MDGFDSISNYQKKDVNEFLNYVIKRTEDNIVIIKTQQDEINRLEKELSEYKLRERNIDYLKDEIEKIKLRAEREADMIILGAKTNADKIVNDALIKTERLNSQKDILNKTVRTYKKKIRDLLIEQIDSIDEIEIL